MILILHAGGPLRLYHRTLEKASLAEHQVSSRLLALKSPVSANSHETRVLAASRSDYWTVCGTRLSTARNNCHVSLGHGSVVRVSPE